MVGKTGFEPATSWSQTTCTTKLCYFPNGAPNRSWTHNLLIRSQTLYPIELWAHKWALMFINGGSDWNRTNDTGIFSPLLYRLSYRAMAVPTGLEPAISCVTGRRVNQLHHRTICNCLFSILNLKVICQYFFIFWL